jgi:hypothetical protein
MDQKELNELIEPSRVKQKKQVAKASNYTQKKLNLSKEMTLDSKEKGDY